MSLPSSSTLRIAELEARVDSLEKMLRRQEPTVLTPLVALRRTSARWNATALGIAGAIALAGAASATTALLVGRREPSPSPPPIPTQPVAVQPIASPTAPPAATTASEPAPASPTPTEPTSRTARARKKSPSAPSIPIEDDESALAPAVAPPQRTGALTVVCVPKCDSIVDNGAQLGPGHIFNRPIPSGTHVLRLSTPAGVVKTVTVEVLPEQTREVRIAMADTTEIPTSRD